MNRDHIIQKHLVEVEYHTPSATAVLKDELAEITKERLIPAMERLFNDYGNDQYVMIEKLEVDAGTIPFNNWQTAFVERVLNELKEKLVHHQYSHPGRGSVQEEQEKHDATMLLHFIDTGSLPWFGRKLSSNELKQTLTGILHRNDKKFISKLREILRQNSRAAMRVAYQFNNEQLAAILSQLSLLPVGFRLIHVWQNLLKGSKITGQEQKKIIYAAALTTAISQPPAVGFNKQFCDYILAGISPIDRVNLTECIIDATFIKNMPDAAEAGLVGEVINLVKNFTPHVESKNIRLQEEDGESHFIKNSGLVILHPFFLGLFENVGYLENKRWRNEALQQRAVALTNFLITGDEELNEFDLLLNKIICGNDIESPLPGFIELSDFEKEEGHDLLTAVINHWKALKNTGPGGLRSTFLIRDGRLILKDGNWLLQVNRQTYDLLLDKLPWGLSVIKLPWMREKILVEWT